MAWPKGKPRKGHVKVNKEVKEKRKYTRRPKLVAIPEPPHCELSCIGGDDGHGYGHGFVWTKFLHKPTGDMLLMKTRGVTSLSEIRDREWFLMPESIEARQAGLFGPEGEDNGDHASES